MRLFAKTNDRKQQQKLERQLKFLRFSCQKMNSKSYAIDICLPIRFEF